MLAAVAILAVIGNVPRGPGIDWVVYYGAGQRVLEGSSPYALYGPLSIPFQHAPWYAWIFAPFALLRSDLAQHVFTGVTVAATLVSLAVLVRTHAVRSDPVLITVLSALTLLLSCLGIHEVQVSHIVLLGAVLGIWALARGRPEVAGLAVLVLLIKPHLMVIFIPALLWRGGRRAWTSALVGLALLTAISFLREPGWPLRLWETATAAWSRPPGPTSWPFFTLLGALGLPRISNVAIMLLWPAGLTWLWKWRSLDTVSWLTLALTLSLALAPYALAYDMLLLVPAVVLVSARLRFGPLGCTSVLALMAVIGPRGPMYLGVPILLALVYRSMVVTEAQAAV